jgi:hypothetical protein
VCLVSSDTPHWELFKGFTVVTGTLEVSAGVECGSVPGRFNGRFGHCIHICGRCDGDNGDRGVIVVHDCAWEVSDGAGVLALVDGGFV